MNLRRQLFSVLVVLSGFGTALLAQEAEPLAPYSPQQNISHTIRIWGDRHMQDLARVWADGFKKNNPGVDFDIHLLGNGTAMPALYLGLADVVVLSRDTIVTDVDGFAHVRNYSPLRIEFGTGSVATPGMAPALALLVSRENPLSRLSLGQVDSIFSSLRLRGGKAAILTWGQLGLSGEWADKPIDLYGDDTQSPSGYFFERVVLVDSRRMNWENYTEFKDIINPDGSIVEGAAQSARALEKDKYGLAISTTQYANGHLKAIALSSIDGGPFIEPTQDGIESRRYPLARPLLAIADKPPGRPLLPKVKAFLTYILSSEGQAAIASTGSYLPLPTDTAAKEAKKVE
jgi:phosphate transport system substrate-binding protein